MELYIIRHAQSHNNALMEDQKLRVQDPPLTEIGFQQAQHLAQWLSTATNLESLVLHPVGSSERQKPHTYMFTHLYCSAMHRAMQTALPIARALRIKPEVWLEIHEQGGIYLDEEGGKRGYPGMTRSQILEQFEDYMLPELLTENGWWNPASGYEDMEGARARAMRVSRALFERAADEETKDDKVALVSHGAFIDCLLKSFLNNLPGDHYFHWHYNTAMTRLDISQDKVVVVRYINRITHLPHDLIT